MSAAVWSGCGGGDETQEAEAPGQYAEQLDPSDLAELPDPFFAVAPQADIGPDDAERIAEARIDAVREYMVWSAIDPQAPAGDFDWSSFDERVETAAQEGVRVLPFLYGTPTWVARDLDGYDCTDDCATFAPRSSDALAAWRAFAQAAVERYGPGGTFWKEHPDLPELPITDWQLWNEQNSPTFFQPKPDIAAYAALVVAGDERIKAADPEAKVALGGMFGTPFQGRPPAFTAWRFLAGIYATPGASDHFDAVAAHPYSARPVGVEDQVEKLRGVMEKAGDADSELWVTELGWSSQSGGNPLNRGPEGQAAQLGETYADLLRMRQDLNLGMIVWYSWRDTENKICDWCPESGLVTGDLEPKPALAVLEQFTQAASGEG